jgi:hypothetical protein
VRRILRVVSGIFATVVLVLGIGAVPASAYAVDHYEVNVCKPSCLAYGDGYIVWGQRTAILDNGTIVNDDDSRGFASIHFTAFAGSRQIDSVVLYGYDAVTFFEDVVIGDPNLPGGIDRIRTQVCWTGGSGRVCGGQWNDIRD